MGKYGKTITDSYQEVLEWTVTAHELQEKKKVSKREIDKLEDSNEHGMVALKLAQSFGTPKEVKTVQDINKRHNRAGSIEHKDQKERDAIIRKYYDMAEEKLDEAQKDIDFARAALTKANIKHVAKQHPMKRSKIIVNVSRKDYKAAEKALGKEFSSQGDNIMLGILESTDLDEGRMKDIVTDVKDALGKIRHRVSQKGSKFIVSVDSNDEEDAQKAMKNHPLYVAGKLRVIPEETELDEAMKYTHAVVDPDGKVAGMSTNEKDAKDIASRHKGKVVMLKKPMSQKKGDMMINRPFKEETELDEKKQLKPNAKFDFDLFSDMKGAKEANADLNKELHKAVRMKDKKSAVAHMRKIQNKYMKFGATDTEPSMTIGTVLDAIFENKEIAELKKEIELDEAKFQVNYSKNNNLYSKTINAKDEDDAEEKAIKKFKIDDDDIRSVVKESLTEDAMIIDLDYSKNPKGLYNAVLQMSKRLGLTIYNAPQAMKDLQTKGKVRLGGKGANLVKFMKHLNDKGIEPSVDVQKGKMKEGIVEKIEYVEYKFKNSRDASSAKSYFDGIQLMKFDVNDDNISNGELMVDAGNKDMTKYHKEVMKKFKPKVMVQEKKLTDAEMKKREEIAKAIEKDDPDMPMDKKMAIATATAKRVAEEEEPKEPEKPDTAKQVDQMRDDKKKTRIAQLQLQIAKATETINKLNAQEK